LISPPFFSLLMTVGFCRWWFVAPILVQQVASFPLPLNRRASHVLLRAKDSACLVLAAGAELWVYSVTGALLASFKEHAMPISSVCVVGCVSSSRSPVESLVFSMKTQTYIYQMNWKMNKTNIVKTLTRLEIMIFIWNINFDQRKASFIAFSQQHNCFQLRSHQKGLKGLLPLR